MRSIGVDRTERSRHDHLETSLRYRRTGRDGSPASQVDDYLDFTAMRDTRYPS